jgi:hypothetical protein
MRKYENRSRQIARESYWKKNDRKSYRCPDCGRSEDEITGQFEVHHKNGKAMDNRPENHVGLCRLCHNLRGGKKPSKKQIRNLRSHTESQRDDDNNSSSTGTPTVYLAGSMDHESVETQSWRSSVAKRDDKGTYRYTGSTPVGINSPTEVSFQHGCGPLCGVAGDDMELIDDSDAILAYFEKNEQVGTLTELVYAVTTGKPALVLFDRTVAPDIQSDPGGLSEGIEHQHAAPAYWFLINFLSGDGWNGLDADVEMAIVDSRDEIKSCFTDWSWHKTAIGDTISNMTPNV